MELSLTFVVYISILILTKIISIYIQTILTAQVNEHRSNLIKATGRKEEMLLKTLTLEL